MQSWFRGIVGICVAILLSLSSVVSVLAQDVEVIIEQSTSSSETESKVESLPATEPVAAENVNTQIVEDVASVAQTPESYPPVIVVKSIAMAEIIEPETTPAVIVTTFNLSDDLEFIEFFNQSDRPMNLSLITVRVSQGAMTCTTSASGGWLLPNNFALVESAISPGLNEIRFSNDCGFVGGITRLEIFYDGNRLQLIEAIGLDSTKWAALSDAWYNEKNKTSSNPVGKRKNFSSAQQTGSFNNDYGAIPAGLQLLTSDLYNPPQDSAGLMITEILPAARSCAPSDTATDCADYVKVVNQGIDDIDLAQYRLRTGSRDSSATTTNAFNWHEATLNPARDELILKSNDYFLLKKRNDGVPLSLTSSNGNVWLEDYYGIKTYQEVSYIGMDLAAAESKSWAYDNTDQTWKYGIPSPGNMQNAIYIPTPEPESETVKELEPCRPGQERNPSTNRCRAIGGSGSAGLVPCRDGQYRSEETNRCRSIASATAALLKPCADDKFRNPETNRCKKIASADEVALADCGEGRERNPETNRCRNILSNKIPEAPFAVEPVADSRATIAGWWALGGIGFLAIGYAAFEWRQELMGAIRKFATFFTSGK